MFVNVLLLNSLRDVVSEGIELLHDPVFATASVVFTLVDLFFTAPDFTFAFGNLELTLDDVFNSRGGPAWRSERIFLDNLLDDCLGRREDSLDDGGVGAARRASCDGHRSCARRNDASWCTDKNLSLTASNFSLTDCDGALTSNNGLTPFWGDKA